MKVKIYSRNWIKTNWTLAALKFFCWNSFDFFTLFLYLIAISLVPPFFLFVRFKIDFPINPSLWFAFPPTRFRIALRVSGFGEHFRVIRFGCRAVFLLTIASHHFAVNVQFVYFVVLAGRRENLNKTRKNSNRYHWQRSLPALDVCLSTRRIFLNNIFYFFFQLIYLFVYWNIRNIFYYYLSVVVEFLPVRKDRVLFLFLNRFGIWIWRINYWAAFFQTYLSYDLLFFNSCFILESVILVVLSVFRPSPIFSSSYLIRVTFPLPLAVDSFDTKMRLGTY